jgi:hypothetical protein
MQIHAQNLVSLRNADGQMVFHYGPANIRSIVQAQRILGLSRASSRVHNAAYCISRYRFEALHAAGFRIVSMCGLSDGSWFRVNQPLSDDPSEAWFRFEQPFEGSPA